MHVVENSYQNYYVSLISLALLSRVFIFVLCVFHNWQSSERLLICLPVLSVRENILPWVRKFPYGACPCQTLSSLSTCKFSFLFPTSVRNSEQAPVDFSFLAYTLFPELSANCSGILCFYCHSRLQFLCGAPCLFKAGLKRGSGLLPGLLSCALLVDILICNLYGSVKFDYIEHKL